MQCEFKMWNVNSQNISWIYSLKKKRGNTTWLYVLDAGSSQMPHPLWKFQEGKHFYNISPLIYFYLLQLNQRNPSPASTTASRPAAKSSSTAHPPTIASSVWRYAPGPRWPWPCTWMASYWTSTPRWGWTLTWPMTRCWRRWCRWRPAGRDSWSRVRPLGSRSPRRRCRRRWR